MAKTVLAKGIDVSNVGQGKIADWSKAAKNIDFALLKICNGYQYDKLALDVQFINNVTACEKYKIPYGVYVYQYFTTVEKAREAAEFTIKALNGHEPTYPIFLDIENANLVNLGKSKLLELAKTFCYYIEKAGFTYGTYANTNWFRNYLTDKWYDNKVKWLAQFYVSEPTYAGEYDIWQYDDKGSVPGINGNVDMNFCYLSFLKGDVDNDGKVTAQDARKILRVSAKLEGLDGQALKNADADGDGDVDAEDARTALRKALGVE